MRGFLKIFYKKDVKEGKMVLTEGGRGDIINELSGDGRRGSGGEKPEGKREKVF